MPFLKSHNDREKSEPLWHTWDRDAQKEGMRDTVYYVNKDEYRGMWKDNKRHGRGRHLYKRTKVRLSVILKNLKFLFKIF